MENFYFDANAIYEGGTKAISSSNFKYSTQLYELNHLLNTAMLQQELINETYVPGKGKTFTISERGKTRVITSSLMPDKVINHVICDEVLTPFLNKYLIYDNGASQVGKGVDFCRRRFEAHLHKYYMEHGTNEGYILLGDFSKYYANIPHDKALEVLAHFLRRSVNNPDVIRLTLALLEKIFKNFGGDKGIDIGNQVSQNIGILYPYRFDNYAKIVAGMKYYGRYTDDFYAISESREELIKLLDGLRVVANEYGIKINERKTRIVKLASFYRFLQNGYSLTASGRLIVKINPKSITRERRKLKSYKRLLDKKIITYDDIENAFKSWIGANFKRMSRLQITQMADLYLELFRRKPRWKKRHGRLRWLMEHDNK